MNRIALLALMLASSSVCAQEGGEPPAQEPAPPEEHVGHPRNTSAGGSEREVPDRIGLFEWSPLNWLDQPTRDLEAWLSENARLDIGFRAAFGFQQASGGPGDRTASSQDYRVYGTFHAINWEEGQEGSAGNVYFRLEFRDRIGEIAPFFLNQEIGTLSTTTYGQDEHDFALVQLYWEQFLADGGLRLRVGKLDPDDYFALGRFADDYRYFDNTLFSAFPASNHPSGGLGVNAQWYISPEWTLTGQFSDVQGRKTEAGFSTFADGHFFYGIDLTFSPDIEGLGRGNYRIGLEYRDDVEDKDRPEDTTFYFNVDQEIANDIAPFFRFGWGTGRSTGIEFAVSVGLGIDNAFNRPGDAFGIGFGFDTASDDAPGPDERDIEYASELFYRFQLTRAMQFTVGGQLIIEPVVDTSADTVGIFEMRLVIDF